MVKKTKVIWAEVITKSAFFDTDDYDVIRSLIFNDETSGFDVVERIQVEDIKIMEETIEEVIKTISIDHLTQKEFVDVVGQIFKEMGEH